METAHKPIPPRGHNQDIELELDPARVYDLRELFPICGRYPLRQTLPWLAAFLVLAGVYLYLATATDFFADNSFLQRKKLLILAVLLAAVLSKYIYAYLYGRFLEYRIDGYRLVVSRGVIFKTVGSVPISHFCEAYVKRDLLDLLTGLYQFQLLLSVDPSKQFVSLHGFTKESALAFQALITRLVNRQVLIAGPEESSVRLSLPKTA